jgi:hypothetical protein
MASGNRLVHAKVKARRVNFETREYMRFSSAMKTENSLEMALHAVHFPDKYNTAPCKITLS